MDLSQGVKLRLEVFTVWTSNFAELYNLPIEIGTLKYYKSHVFIKL